VLAIAGEGAVPAARSWSSVRAMVIRVLEETGLPRHRNPGVMSWPDFQHPEPVAVRGHDAGDHGPMPIRRPRPALHF
jgi:hypothetical protein